MTRRPSYRSERGSALVELTWLGILLLVPLVWVVTSAFEVQNGAFAVSGASRAAGRAFALAPDDATGVGRARAAAQQVFADQGVAATPVVGVSCQSPADCHSGEAVVTVTVTTNVRLPLLPSVLGGGAPTFRLTSTHTFPIGRYVEIGGAAP